MKLVITGASGFFGSRIADFYKTKYEVFAPSHAEMDITSIDSVRSCLERVRPDIIIHCAAVSDVGQCAKEPERSWQINVTGSENIALVASEIGARCIMCSSDQVYFGSDVDAPHSEEEQVVPCHEYGRQKLTMEQRCLQINPQNVMLRLAWMYDLQKRNEHEHGNFMTTLLENIKEKRELCYPVYDKRSITDVNEAVRNIEKTFDTPGGVYNFGAYNDQSTYETMKHVFARMDGMENPQLRENKTAFADNHRNLCMSDEKAKKYGITFLTTTDGIYRALCEAK